MRIWAMKKQTQNKANFRNGQNECNLKYNKGLWQFWALRPQKNKPKQSQFQMQSSLAQTMRFDTLERRVVMAHLCRYWQTKWNYQINSLRKVVEKC